MPHYKKPPIQEALIDIKVTYEEFDIAIADRLYESVQESLPTKTARNALSFKLGPEGSSVKSSEVDGYMLQSADGSRVLQVTKEGFTFSLVNNYESWESFYEEASGYWEAFKELMNPVTVTRIGLRYINKLELPVEFEKIPEYIKSQIELQSGAEQPTEIFTRIVVPMSGHTCIVTQATNQSLVDAANRGYIIDIDAFEESSFEASDTERVGTILGELREIKNTVFENSITDKTRELFA